MTERRHDIAPGRATLVGVVREFDEAAGLGVIDGSDGAEFGFHCVEIADGTRRIDPGTPVAFATITKLGRREAVAIHPAPGAEPAVGG